MTLEEAKNADLLLHVVDASSPAAVEQIAAVDSVLDKIGCGASARIIALNKADAVDDLVALNVLAATHPRSVVLSALKGEGLRDLAVAVAAEMSKNVMEVKIRFPAAEGRIYAGICARGELLTRSFAGDDIEVRARVPRRYMDRLARDFPSIKFLSDSPSSLEDPDG